MSQSSGNATLIAIIVVVLVLVGAVFVYKSYQKNSPAVTQPFTYNTPASSGNPSVDSLDQDTKIVDQDMDALDKDLANVNTGLNDKSTDLTY